MDWHLWSSVLWSHSRVLVPVAAPRAVVGGGDVLVGEAMLLLGVGGLRQEREEPVDGDHFQPALFDRIKALLVG